MKIKSLPNFILKLGLGLLILLALLIVALRLWQMEWMKQGQTDLSFTAAELPFHHQIDLDQSLPFMGSAAVDVDGDKIDEVFLGGGRNQDDALFKYKNGAFEKLPFTFQKDENSATHGAAHLDVDEDGDTDIFTAGESGVWLHLNQGDSFSSSKITFDIADNTTPLSVSLGDINKDGFVDLYISGYIKNSLVEGQTIFIKPYGGYSYLLLNNGDNTWRDVTKEAGLWRQHNTFTAVFADLDNDSDSDLVIAQDTGVIEMYENTGTFPMRPIPNPSVYSYPMGLAVGDYNGDGLVDIFASNVGHTLPGPLLRGDLEKDAPFNPDYMLLRNDGDLRFTDVAQEAEVARLGFGWGTVFADLDVDGHLDLLAAQNYAKFPMNNLMYRYSGKVLKNYGNGQFIPIEKVANAKNKAFGISPVIGDFNGDKWPDIAWANLQGPAKAYINNANGPAPTVVHMPNTAAFLNKGVQFPINATESIYRQIIANQGLGADQTRALFLPQKIETAERE